MTSPRPKSVLSRELLPASFAIYTLVGLAAFDSLGVAAALPELAADLGQVQLLPWVITTFLLVSGVATVLAGALIDGLGTRVVFRTSVVVFLAGSLLGGLAPTMPTLIVARLIQGIGGGAVLSVGLAAVNLLYPPHLIGRAFAANSTVWGVMGVAGPGLAAFLLTVASWRWIFFVNLPLGLFALAAGWSIMPGRLDGAKPVSLDGRGLGLILAFNLLLLAGVDSFNRWSLVLGSGALALGLVYLRHARSVPEPVMKRRHLIEPPFGLLGWSLAFLVMSGIAVHSFFTVYVRGARGAGQATTAWSVLFFVVGWTAGANLSSRLLDRMADSRVILFGFGASLTGLVTLAYAALNEMPLPVLFAAMFLTGSGIGLGTNAGLTLLQSVAENTEIGRATAAHQFYRNLGFTLGAALGGAVILFVVSRQVGDVDAVRALLAGTGEAGGTADPSGAATALADGFTNAALAATLLAAAGLIPLLGLRRYLAPRRILADRARKTPPRYEP